MRTVTNRKELIKGIEEGERQFIVKGKLLLLQCKLASMFNGKKDVTNAMVTAALPNACASLAISGTTLIVLSAMAIVGAIAILAILKGRKLKIKVKDCKGNEAEIEIS